MGRIFVMMGKSACGKDTLYEKLIRRSDLNLRKIVEYTTRPARDHEVDGADYHFATIEELEKYRDSGKLIEERCFDSVMGPWYYFNVDDGSLELDKYNYLAITTLPAFMDYRKYFGADKVIPIYVIVDDKERIHRALAREDCEKDPHYAEMCRRFLADTKDFNEINLNRTGITADEWFVNDYLDDCVERIAEYIKKYSG